MKIVERPPGTPARLDAFCEQEQGAWRVHVHPAGLPEYLESCFDLHGEAYPVYLDFEELARQLSNRAGDYRQHETRLGGVELTASGGAADSVAAWLLSSLSSGLRPR